MRRFWDWLLRRRPSPVPDVAPDCGPYRTIAKRPEAVDPYEGDIHAELWSTVDRARADRRMTEEEYEQELHMDNPPPPKIVWR